MNAEHSAFRARYRRGVTLVDTMLCVAILASTAYVAAGVFTNLHSASNATRLERDTRTLNAAVAAYLNNGGRIPADAGADSVLAKLKTSADATGQRTLAGLRGSLIDHRLKGQAIALGTPGQRIVWDHSLQAFRIRQSGAGWSGMLLDETESTRDHGMEDRRTTQPFSSAAPWVWDYAETVVISRGPQRIPVSHPAITPQSIPEHNFELLPPDIQPASGEYGYNVFPMEVTVINPNSPGVAVVRYSVDGAEWQTWSGGGLNLPRELTHNVRAFAEALDGESWVQSTTMQRDYVTYFIRGHADAEFVNPAGETRFVHSISADGRDFLWGKVESPGQTRSSLQFIAAPAFEAGPGETFTVATLRYTNGVSRAGTNAVGVTVAITLPLTVPEGSVPAVNVPLRIHNSIHYPWTPAGEHLDFLWVADTIPVTQPVVILDRIYRLTLHPQVDGSTQDGTDLKIPVAENESVEVTLSARLDPL